MEIEQINKIAKAINNLENMPNNENFYRVCVLVAEDLYGFDYHTAIHIADIIQNEYQ